MRRWWQVGTRNWRAKPVRTLLAVSAIALGVSVVVWVTCCYESVRRSVTDTVTDWIGRAHVTVESVAGRWALFDATVADGLDQLPGVKRITTRTLETVNAEKVRNEAPSPDEPGAMPERLDLVGLDPSREEGFRHYPIVAGRMLRPGDDRAVLIEELLAREWKLGVGDKLYFEYPQREKPVDGLFEIVGLVDRRRVSSHQLPMAWTTIAAVQYLTDRPGKIKGIDFILSDDSETGIRSAAADIRKAVRPRDKTLKVATAEAQLKQLRSAQSQLQFVLMLLSCVALLTAFFIILSTMSMGVSERIAQLGLLRCVGTTRGQLLALVLIDALPIGALGVVLGVPIGLGLQLLTIRLVPDYVGQVAVSVAGIALAVGGGLGTTLLGAMGPAIRAAFVSPIAAARAAPTRRGISAEVVAAVGGLLLIALHHALIGRIDSETPHFATLALAALLVIYAGYALVAPAVVLLLGELAVRIAAVVLRVRRQLVSDQVGRQPWRAAGVCCGLMVGLSLIVTLQVHSESVKAGWQFPKEFPEAMVYSWDDAPLENMQSATQVTGVGRATLADDVKCKLVRRGGSGFLSALDPFYRFIAGDPDTFPGLIKLVYLEGREEDALARLKRGGAVLVTREFSQARNIHLNDKVKLQVGEIDAVFDVAGVVASPALDIAVSFFQAQGEFQVYAVGSFIGTLADARRIWARSSAKLLLFNFNLPESPADAATPAGPLFDRLGRRPTKTDAGELAEEAVGHLKTAAQASGTEAEKAVVNEMLERIRSPRCAYVTARQLKQSIDQNIDRVTLLLAAIPTVGLIVAALGVANLMMANVASRVRQIAVLRAIGTTRGQVIRLVVAEALILGVLGGGMGLVMGLHMGRSSNELTHALWGFEPLFAVPWRMVLAGAGLAIGLCLLAGIGPARVASRSNIVAVLHSA